MKQPVVAALFCAGLAQLATGCVNVEPSTITAKWTLVQGDLNQPAECPPGATTIAVYSFADAGTADTPIIDTFLCDALEGTTDDMPVGPYLTHIQLENDNGSVLYAQSRSTDVTVFDQGNVELSFEMSLDRAQFAVSWAIYDGDNEIDCATAMVDNFALEYTDSAGEYFDTDFRDCDLHSTVTPGLPLDRWTVTPSLVDAADQAIVVGDAIEAEFTYGNELIHLGDLVMDLQGPSPAP